MEFNQQQQQPQPTSFKIKSKLRSTLLCTSCCNNIGQEVEKVLEEATSSITSHKLFSTWLPTLFSSKSHAGHRHRPYSSPSSDQFRYDPLSYALNFDDDLSRLDEYPLRDFSARLPPSPKPNAVVSAWT